MAVDERAAERLAPDTATILSLCDRLLGEVGRRQHRFAWLRGQDGDWLPLDAYYPRHRLVVVCADDADQVFEQLAAAHALRLLTIRPSELAEDRDARLERMLGPVRARPAAAAPVEPSMLRQVPADRSPRAGQRTRAAHAAPAPHSAAAQRGRRFVTRHRVQTPHTRPDGDHTLSLLAGLAVGVAIVGLLAIIVLVVVT